MNPGFLLVENPPNTENQPMRNQNLFPPLSDLSEHSFGMSRPNVARISWNFEWYQFFILAGPVTMEGGYLGIHTWIRMDMVESHIWILFEVPQVSCSLAQILDSARSHQWQISCRQSCSLKWSNLVSDWNLHKISPKLLSLHCLRPESRYNHKCNSNFPQCQSHWNMLNIIDKKSFLN